MSVRKGPDLEREERREKFEELLSALESIDEARIKELEERGLSDEELAVTLLDLVAEKERPAEFFGEPVSTNLQQEFFQ